MNSPSFENFTTRGVGAPLWPSATKISPLGAVTTAAGRLKVSRPLPATPVVPRVSSTFPSGLNLTTVWPFPSRPCPSVTHTLPARSTWRPCGNTKIPAPKLFRSFPDRSNLRTGPRFESTQLFAPHLSRIQMFPSGSMLIALMPPQVRSAGAFAHPSSTTRYGLDWARTPVPNIGIAARAAAATMNFIRRAWHMTVTSLDIFP